MRKKIIVRNRESGEKVSWLNIIPLVLFFFAAALMYWAGIGFTGFFGSLIIPVSLFLLVPLLRYVGISKHATNWFVRAGLISLIAVVMNLIPLFLNPTSWAFLVIDIAYLLTIVAVIIGVLTSLIRTRN
jgi:hypothetical protein